MKTHLLEFTDTDDRDAADATVRFGIPNKLRAALARSNRWGRVRCEVTYAMASKYSIALYELVCLRINLQTCVEAFPIKRFRELLGVPPGSYADGQDFRRKVIDPAVLEVNSLSDMHVDIDLRRRHARPTMLGDKFATCWMTRDWTLRERLRALADFRATFEREGFTFAEQVPAARDGELIVLGGVVLSDDACRFLQELYSYGWVRVFDWAGWHATVEGERMLHDPDAIAGANEDDLARVLTTCARADRFCEGYLAEAYDAGLIGRVVLRAGQLLAAAEAQFGR